jgi:hypothetical protein
LDIFDKMSRVTKTIGKSVMMGAIATFIPSFLLCFNVSEITNVNNGPGDTPRVKPKMIPESKKVNSSSIHYD